jgi:hypothetical protein
VGSKIQGSSSCEEIRAEDDVNFQRVEIVGRDVGTQGVMLATA